MCHQCSLIGVPCAAVARRRRLSGTSAPERTEDGALLVVLGGNAPWGRRVGAALRRDTTSQPTALFGQVTCPDFTGSIPRLLNPRYSTTLAGSTSEWPIHSGSGMPHPRERLFAATWNSGQLSCRSPIRRLHARQNTRKRRRADRWC
jgi:hypothetical protein